MGTELTWLGHGTWSVKTGETNLLLDPFLDESPSAPVKADAVEADYILVSHGHGDHVGDLVKVAKRTGALVIAIHEIAQWAAGQGVENVHGMNIGGGYDFPFGRVYMTPALHSSMLPDGSYGGDPSGFLLTLEGKTIYFACDTGLFSDMKLIGDAGLDLAVLPIGDNFTMGPDDAVKAVQFLRPVRVVPDHYNTWPLITQDAEAWGTRVKLETSALPEVVEPGGKVIL